MIFSHGFGCDQNMWRYIFPRFIEDYKIVLYDHVGAGNSELAAFDYQKYNTLEGYAADLLEICQELEIYDAVLVGHSVGAMIGVLSAIAQPERFSKLILITPSPCYLNQNDYYGGFDFSTIEGMLQHMKLDYADWSGIYASFIMGNPDNPSLAEELAYSFCHTDAAIAQHFARVTFLSDNRKDLNKLKTKSLILQCSNDAIAPEEVGEYMQKHLANTTLVKLKATGHCPNLSAPLETIAAMENFLF
ncbi:MAG: alpha/beta fold hydrolase [Adhaeribacter sp.]